VILGTVRGLGFDGVHQFNDSGPAGSLERISGLGNEHPRRIQCGVGLERCMGKFNAVGNEYPGR
jgi:hypothetical protein